MKGFIRELSITLACAVAIYLIFFFVIQYSIVDGSSMLPGLQNNQRLLVVKPAYLFNPPQRGDIVIIRPPVAPEKQWVKRVIGLPGDTVAVREGHVYVNGTALKEPYINEEPRYPLAPCTIPEGRYFVLGDNRNDSTDSHYGWTVPRENIVGEVWLRVWPLNQWGVVSGYPLGAELSKPSRNQANILNGAIAWP